MTDGTSQGLFVVVAIVIFGIFVAISYTVFGNEGLSGSLPNLFEQAIEKSSDSVPSWEVVWSEEDSEGELLEGFLQSYVLRHNPDNPDSFSFEPNSDYIFTVDVDILSGELKYLRGNLHVSEFQKLYVNGVQYRVDTDNADVISYGWGTAFDNAFQVGDSVTVEVLFDSNMLESTPENTQHLSLNINRYMEHGGWVDHDVPTEVMFRNIKLLKR